MSGRGAIKRICHILFIGKGRLRPADDELRRLKKELEDVKQERDILKKALAIFSKEPK